MLEDHEFSSRFQSVTLATCIELNLVGSKCDKKTMKKEYETIFNKFIKGNSLMELITSEKDKKKQQNFICNTVFDGLLLNYHRLADHFENNINTECPYGLEVYCNGLVKILKAFVPVEDKGQTGKTIKTKFVEDKETSNDIIGKAKLASISRLSFSESGFDTHGHWKRKEQHGHHFFYSFFKFLFYTGILSGCGYGGWIYYKKRKENNASSDGNEEYYSMLTGSGL